MSELEKEFVPHTESLELKELGEKTYRVSKNSYLVSFHKYESNKDESKYFSTLEEAQEYIILNKPCLSYNEVIDWHNNLLFEADVEPTLQELVKSKL
jgi:hypothetical protein